MGSAKRKKGFVGFVDTNGNPIGKSGLSGRSGVSGFSGPSGVYYQPGQTKPENNTIQSGFTKTELYVKEKKTKRMVDFNIQKLT